jgi:hypothetical protein
MNGRSTSRERRSSAGRRRGPRRPVSIATAHGSALKLKRRSLSAAPKLPKRLRIVFSHGLMPAAVHDLAVGA